MLTFGYFLAKTADLLAPALKRASATDADGNTVPVNAEHPEQRAVQLAAIQGGAAYTQSIVKLTARQIAGTDPILQENLARRALQFGGAARDFAVSLTKEQAKGLSVFASARDDLVGKLCPLGALYLATGSGFAVDDILVVWEA